MTVPFEQYGPTIRVEGGIRAQSTRGAIGESWWSKRFLAVLESFAIGSRLTRGRNYARKGQVLSLEIGPGEVKARVQGSRPRPYDVKIGLAALDNKKWAAVEATLAEQALFSARLLAGDMPQQIEEVFAAAGASLFPTNFGQLDMHCSCPDYQVPCKHLAATFYLLAEAFDADPFQILHWRGKDRQTLLADLRAHRATGSPEDDESPDIASEVDTGERGKGRRSKKDGVEKTGVQKAGTEKAGTEKASAKGAGAKKDRALLGAFDEVAAPAPARIGAVAALADFDSPDLADVMDRFWVSPVPLPARPATLDTNVDLLLRQLSSPDSVLGGAELLARLRTLYAALPHR